MERILHFAPLPLNDEQTNNAYVNVCVYRVLKRYVEVTAPIRVNTIQLFVTFAQGKQGKPACKSTIASWIKKCIVEAYSRQKLPLPKVNAHSTRRQSTSWAEMNSRLYLLNIFANKPVGLHQIHLSSTTSWYYWHQYHQHMHSPS